MNSSYRMRTIFYIGNYIYSIMQIMYTSTFQVCFLFLFANKLVDFLESNI